MKIRILDSVDVERSNDPRNEYWYIKAGQEIEIEIIDLREKDLTNNKDE